LIKRLTSVAAGIRISERDRRARAWNAAGSRQTLQLEYALGPDSMVFDLGGYEGQWSSDIVAKYLCHIHVFEPVPRMADRIAKRFARNPLVAVHDFGLGPETTTAKIWLDGDASSMLHSRSARNKGLDVEDVRIIGFQEFLQEQAITAIDLMKINIEGAEYDLLEYIIERDMAGLVANLQVQFHDFAPDAEARMTAIQYRLAATHELTYQSRFVWENWRRRE
jgi:FkbM family methyltransferase